MIEIKNGVFKGGDLKGIIDIKFKTVYDIDDYFDNPVTENCWVLVIPKNITEMTLFNAHENDIVFIPDEISYSNKYFEMFWDSEHTFLFPNKESAINFISTYHGQYADDVELFYKGILKRF